MSYGPKDPYQNESDILPNLQEATKQAAEKLSSEGAAELLQFLQDMIAQRHMSEKTVESPELSPLFFLAIWAFTCLDNFLLVVKKAGLDDPLADQEQKHCAAEHIQTLARFQFSKDMDSLIHLGSHVVQCSSCTELLTTEQLCDAVTLQQKKVHDALLPTTNNRHDPKKLN